MHWFFYDFTPSFPYLSSAIKFLILGTLGEFFGSKLRGNKFYLVKLPFKLLIWALLGIIIKWIFSSFTLLIISQAQNGLLPASFEIKGSLLFAIAVSCEMNIFFTPILFYFHRFLDNIIDKKWNFSGLEKALSTILWFWIPAHTVTFLLPNNFQILFAGILSIVLGVILGLSNTKK